MLLQAGLNLGIPQPWWEHGRAGGQQSRARSTGGFARFLAWHAEGAEPGALTDVGVLQEAADPGFSFQLLVI